MRKGEVNAFVRAIRAMNWSQRLDAIRQLEAVQAPEQADAIVEERLQTLRMCPHCWGMQVMRNGFAGGLQRYRCRDCARSFNALAGTPLARLRYRARWLRQTQALVDGLSIAKAAQQLAVARSTAFRWCHRFLALPQHVKAARVEGIVEAYETCLLKSFKGQRARRGELGRPPRARGGRATQRGMSEEHDMVLVVRDRSGACTDQVVQALDTAHLAAVLEPVLAADAALCTDGSGALAAAARHIGVEHHAIDVSAGRHAIGPWHINNVNGHHSILKTWLRRFNGVASSDLRHYLGWFRVLDRFRHPGLTPSAMLALAVGI